MAALAPDGEVPAFSLNPNITNPADVAVPAPADAKKQDPKLSVAWVLWEQCASGEFTTRPVLKMSTVKQFWSCFNSLPQPSQLLEGKRWMRTEKGNKEHINGFMLFKDGIKPEWEDEQNANGGHYQLELKPDLGGAVIDELWNNVVLGVVGDLIEPADMVTGVRLIDKLADKNPLGKVSKPVVRLELWINDFSDEDKKYKLRGSFEKMLRQRLDGSEATVSWGYTQTKPHSRQK
mmetsp:Transcript_12588/g.22233  ORF Transcript_12588/g.22233 Transcript_12588/m.22233 type:complete len:234 (-) Transcript_12588:102-803(-)